MKSNPSLNPNPFTRMLSPLRRARASMLPDRPTAPVATPATSMAPTDLIDYRDRISIATWLLVFGMGLRLLFTMPAGISYDFAAFGSPISIAITDYVVAALLLAVLAASCTESVISVHPALTRRTLQSARRTWAFWALPTALTIIAVVLLPYAPTRELQVLGLLVYGVMIATTFYSLYATVEVGLTGYRRGRAVLNALTYGSALLLFVIVYQTRTRSLLSGTMVAATATLLTIELLRSSAKNSAIGIQYGLAVGMVLGQMTWALNYWPINELTGGLLLALIFYLMVGIAQLGLDGRLRRRVLMEYAAFALLALLLIAAIGRGFNDNRDGLQPVQFNDVDRY